MKNFIVKALVRSYYVGKRVEFKAPSNGTIRFNVYKRNNTAIGSEFTFTRKPKPLSSGFYRIRTIKSRPLQLIEGDTFKTLHFGKISLGLETGKRRTTSNFAGN